MINLPTKFVVGKKFPGLRKAFVLREEDLRYHPKAGGLKSPVVVFYFGSKYRAGHEAGTHDGVRDGALSGRHDWSHQYMAYTSMEEWVEAGNPDPRKEEVYC